jgi:hypothetical protein
MQKQSGKIFTTMQTPAPSTGGRVMWIPLLLVGSFLYWTTALGLGGLSLSFLGGGEEEDLALEEARPQAVEAPAPTVPAEEPIVVHLQDSASWTHGAAGTTGSDDEGTGSLPATDDSPGSTSY